MRIRDLGALVVVADGEEQPVSGLRASAALALLAIHGNQRVSVDALMYALWGDSVSKGAASTLASHIWRLRQMLEPDRGPRQPSSVLVNESDGYRLVCGPSTLDSLHLADAVADVKDLLVVGHAEGAVVRADEALAMWRGRPYGVFADSDWANTAVERLEELHRQLQERRVEALLLTGAAETSLVDLPGLIAEAPYRESLRGLHMQALYQAGRTEDALQVYRDSRRILVEEMGIEPSTELQGLHARILRNDPTLTRAPSRLDRRKLPVEVHLPAALTPLVGRSDVVTGLARLLDSANLVTVVGAAGCGKTRVAVEVARSAAPAFPDGVWFVDLTPVSEPELVNDVIASTIGLAASSGATPLQDVSRYLQTRRLLLVLDNCEHVLESVSLLVRTTLGSTASAPQCRLLLTSREPIGVTGETIWTLDPLALPDETTAPASSPAVQLFLQRLALARPLLGVDQQVVDRASRIASALDGLPLPIELAAARTLSHSLDDIAEQVSADPSRLARVDRGPVDHRTTVRSAVEWSHRLLRADERRAHRRLAVLPGTFTSASAAAVVGRLGGSDIDDVLARLVHQSMLQPEGGRTVSGRSVFRQLSTIRSHARHTLSEAGETNEASDRRDDWAAALLAGRPVFGTHAHASFFHRIDEDYAAIRGSLARLLIEEPAPEGARMAHRLTYYWFHRDGLIEARGWLERALTTTQKADPTDLLLVHIWLAAVQTVQRRLDLVRPQLDQLRVRVRGVPDDRLAEVGEGLVGLALAAYICEDAGLLHEFSELTTAVCARVDSPTLTLLASVVRCCSLLLVGQLDDAVEAASPLYDRATRDGVPLAAYVATAPMIAAALKQGRPEDGIVWIDRCMTAHATFGSGSVGMFIETRGNFTAQAGDYAEAARRYAVSRAITRRAALIWPNRSWTRELLARTREELGEHKFQQAWREGEMTTTNHAGDA